jgi:hypothetical protein
MAKELQGTRLPVRHVKVAEHGERLAEAGVGVATVATVVVQLAVGEEDLRLQVWLLDPLGDLEGPRERRRCLRVPVRPYVRSAEAVEDGRFADAVA